GDHVAGAALGVEAGERLVEVAALARPAAGGQGPAAHVEAHRDPVPVLGDDLADPVGVLHRGGADVDPGAPGRQGTVERGVVPDAAGHLNLDVQLADHVGQQAGV